MAEPTFTDQGGNTLRCGATDALLRASDDDTVALIQYVIAQQDVTIPADTARYVGIQYNGGDPNYVVKDSDSWDGNSEFRAAAVYNEGGTIHIYTRLQRSKNLQYWLTHRLQEVEGLSRADYLGGLILGESDDGNKYVTLSGGELYVGLDEFVISAFDTSGADRFDSYYRDGGTGFTKVASQQAWQNTHWDDNTGTLNTLGASKYGLNWFYLETDGHVVHVYGRGEYSTLQGALAETPPTTVPGRVDIHGVLLGGIIMREGNNTAEVVLPSFSVTYGPAAITAHNTLSGLGADDHTQYLLTDGARALTGDWDAGSFDITAEQLYFDSTLGGEGMVGYSGFFGNKINAANTAVFCHQAQKASTTKYAFSQNSSGVTNFNGAEPVNIRVNDNVKIRVYANYTDFQGGDLTNIDDIIGNGGTIISGGTGAGDDLYLQSTTHATKNDIFLGTSATTYAKWDEANGKFYIVKSTGDNYLALSSGDASGVGISCANSNATWYVNVAGGGEFNILDSDTGTLPFSIDEGAADYTLHVDANSRVGVGTSAPDQILHVKKTVSPTYIHAENTASNSVSGIILENDAQSWYLYTNTSDDLYIKDGSTNYVPFKILVGCPTNTLYLDAAGNVGVGGAPTASVKLGVSSTTGAFLLPRMTTAQMNALTAINGMVIYNTTNTACYAYENGAWVNL
jgi:hypothetical protein